MTDSARAESQAPDSADRGGLLALAEATARLAKHSSPNQKFVNFWYARYTRAVGAGKGGRLSYTKLDEAWHEMAGHEYADLSFRYCVVARESGKASALLDAEQVLLCDESSCSHDRSFFYPP